MWTVGGNLSKCSLYRHSSGFHGLGSFLSQKKKQTRFLCFFFFFLNGIPVEISFQKNVLIMVAN